jgi:hypothetical protein
MLKLCSHELSATFKYLFSYANIATGFRHAFSEAS